jgi:DNA-binding NarL/FixJ family response regulator
VLVLGDAEVSARRAHQLRLRGLATWVASTEDELTWLLDVAKIRPDHAIVDLDVPAVFPPTNRLHHLARLARLASIAELPVVLVGAEKEDEAFFRRVLALLPRDPGNSAIIKVLSRDSAA